MVKKTIIYIGVVLGSVIFTLSVLDVGLTPKPNVQPQHNTWGTTMTTLDDGTRSNGSQAVQNGTEPILALGDSFTWGDHVSDWESWPARLEQLSGRKVVNGGVPGYG